MDSDGGGSHIRAMSVAAFETLKLARTLREKAKLTPEQAEGIADALSDAFREEIATKADLRELELRLSAKIDGSRAETKSEIQAVKSEMLRWIIPLLLAQMAVMIGVLIRAL